MLTVVAAFIPKDDQVLIAKRLTGTLSIRGKWEFPGGKVENGEEEMAAIEREIQEEFDLKIKALRFLTNYISEDSSFDLRLYECKCLSSEVSLHDHSEYQWVKIEELLNYDLAPADIFLARYLIGEKK